MGGIVDSEHEPGSANGERKGALNTTTESTKRTGGTESRERISTRGNKIKPPDRVAQIECVLMNHYTPIYDTGDPFISGEGPGHYVDTYTDTIDFIYSVL
ncbi:hypothetical protein Trydic_g966 [Trypoxylus dichotomus]